MVHVAADSIHNQICTWIRENYTTHTELDNDIIMTHTVTANLTALSYIAEQFDVGNDFHFVGWEDYACDMMPQIKSYFDNRPALRSGAMLFRFENKNSTEQFEVLVLSAWVFDSDMNATLLSLASVPNAHTEQWLALQKEVQRIYRSAIPYRGKVYVVGGAETTFDSTVAMDDIYLEGTLKEDIIKDIDAFFEKGVGIYQRLNIKPFRKMLFAGVPGTGKTMLCSAIAGWGQDKDYFVVYVSGSNQYGAKFWKIHEALDMAASSDARTIVIVEELDSYLDDENKAQMLNVLDGSESPSNKHGTILIATTNHPERIDDRILKRPGRLDRVFIIPELESEAIAQKMLQQYLGEAWHLDHQAIIPDLIGRPGAFIREMALYALTMAAYNEQESLSLDMLQESLATLVKQIEAKDDFLTSHKKQEMGLGARKAKRNNFLYD